MERVATLVLPGAVQGLLRPGTSPIVFMPRQRYQDALRASGSRGTFLGLDSRGWAVCVFGEEVEAHPLSCIALDLAEATGRAHATWWLASMVMPQAVATIAWLWCMGDGRWSLRSGDDWVTFRAPGSPEPSLRRPEVSALASLDPYDRRKLPDESWMVNAEALQLICLHVKGAT